MNASSHHRLLSSTITVELLASQVAPFSVRILTVVWEGTVIVRIRNKTMPAKTAVAELTPIKDVITPKVGQTKLQEFYAHSYVVRFWFSGTK